MARDYRIAGETLVIVKGGAHLVSGSVGRGIADGRELGLSADAIQLSPRFIHQDIKVDDFGPQIPADVMWNLADITIRMNLVHYDREVLDVVARESCGGGRGLWGVLAPTGTIMGGNKFIFSSGWHYMSLNLRTNDDFSWRFRAAYLSVPPIEIPLSTRRSVTQLTWRAIPYREPTSLFNPGEIVSSGVVLFDHTIDGYSIGL